MKNREGQGQLHGNWHCSGVYSAGGDIVLIIVA